jgi:acyl-CoA dehydrogenase
MPSLNHEQLAHAQRIHEAILALEPGQPGTSLPELHRTLTELGLYPLLLPHAFGGARDRVDFRGLCAVREELAYRNPALDALFAIQGLATHPLLHRGEERLQQTLLPRVARGAALFAFALTESEAGSDPAGLSTRAERDGERYVLTGQKRFVVGASIATHFTVFARTGEGKAGVSAFIVPSDAQGLHVSELAMLGDHPICDVRLDAVHLPRSARLGAEGEGLKLAFAALDAFRPAVGASAVGLGRRALEAMVLHAKTRHQFGAPLANLGAVQRMLAESACDLDAARLLVLRAAEALDSGQASVSYESSVAKLFATEAAVRIVDRCVQVHGAAGMVVGALPERLYRTVRAARIYEGASEVHHGIIARELVRRP